MEFKLLFDVCVEQPSSGRREKGSGSQGKSSSEKGRTKTYLMASHRKKREQVMPNNLESDEVDPEIQVRTCVRACSVCACACACVHACVWGSGCYCLHTYDCGC